MHLLLRILRFWRSALTAFATLIHVTACGSQSCPQGEVANAALKTCVVPKVCDAGAVLTDKNQCIRSGVVDPLITYRVIDMRKH